MNVLMGDNVTCPFNDFNHTVVVQLLHKQNRIAELNHKDFFFCWPSQICSSDYYLPVKVF